MTAPTFVIAGAQRSGTTTLYRLLDAHPRVHLAKPIRPEPKYFLEDPRPGRDRAWYERRWFADVDASMVAGEKSTSYLDDERAPLRMVEQYPELRVIICLRHPFERAVSNYLFSKRGGFENESFDHAIADEERRLREDRYPQVSAHPQAYLWRGRYASRLRPFVDNIAPERLHIVLLEDLLERCGPTVVELHDFLGVPRVEIEEMPHVNRSEIARITASTGTIQFMREALVESNAWLGEYLERDLSHWNTPPDGLFE